MTDESGGAFPTQYSIIVAKKDLANGLVPYEIVLHLAPIPSVVATVVALVGGAVCPGGCVVLLGGNVLTVSLIGGNVVTFGVVVVGVVGVFVIVGVSLGGNVITVVAVLVVFGGVLGGFGGTSVVRREKRKQIHTSKNI